MEFIMYITLGIGIYMLIDSYKAMREESKND